MMGESGFPLGVCPQHVCVLSVFILFVLLFACMSLTCPQCIFSMCRASVSSSCLFVYLCLQLILQKI